MHGIGSNFTTIYLIIDTHRKCMQYGMVPTDIVILKCALLKSDYLTYVAVVF